MLEGVTNNIAVNKQNPYWNMGTTANNPAQRTTGTLERQPMADNVELSKKPMSKQTKTLLTLGGIATAVIGTILAVKGYRSHQISKGLEQIEQKFLKLQENMPEVQKTFEEVFLRSDITEEEALEMLNRYKEVEKVSITGSKEEYIQAVFNEAKRNFGLQDCKFRLEFKKGKVSKNGKTAGGASVLCDKIEIDPIVKIKKIQGLMHHEMRHMKQIYYMINYNTDKYIDAIYKKVVDNWKIEGKKCPELDDEYREAISNYLKKGLNLAAFSKNNIPKEHISYTEQLLEARGTYVRLHTDFNTYYNNFIEVDARHAGGLIDKLFHGTVFCINK